MNMEPARKIARRSEKPENAVYVRRNIDIRYAPFNMVRVEYNLNGRVHVVSTWIAPRRRAYRYSYFCETFERVGT